LCQPQSPTSATSSPIAAFVNVGTSSATTTQATNNHSTFDAMALMQQFIAAQQSQTIVVESRTNKSRETEAKFNNDMLRLLLVGGDVDFTSPGTFQNPCIPNYTQAMKNILSQPTTVGSILAVNILTTVFNEIPEDMAKRLSPLTTHKLMHHISKNFALALLSCNFQLTNLNFLNYETNSITILSFVEQNDLEKISAYCEAEHIAKNEHKIDYVKSHCKALKTTIEGLGKISSMDCIVKICANVCCGITALFDVQMGNPVPLLYSVCIKMIEVIKHPEFIKWHNKVHSKVPQLPNIFLICCTRFCFSLQVF
jgi:hypothetical protein